MSRKSLPTLGRAMAQMQFRLTLLAIALAGFGALVTSGVVINSYVRQNLQLVARLASYSAEPAVVFRDRDAVWSAIWPLVASDGVRAIIVTGDGGLRVNVQRDPRDPAFSPARTRLAAGLWPDPVLTQIRRNGQVIGTVRVYAGFGGLGNYLALGAGCVLACLLITIWLTQVLAFRLQRQVMGPLRALAQLAHRVRDEQALHLRAQPAPIAEIDSLGRDFNALLDELESWHMHLRSENESLAHLATHDKLTGLGNRALLESRLDSAITIATNADAPLGVLYLDANHFKAINDHHGHAAGDALLIELAARIRRELRRGDVAARVGGDEFAILLAPPADRSAAAALAQRISQAMLEPVVLPGGSDVVVSVSIGIAIFPRDGQDGAALFRAADDAMYMRKRVPSRVSR